MEAPVLEPGETDWTKLRRQIVGNSPPKVTGAQMRLNIVVRNEKPYYALHLQFPIAAAESEIGVEPLARFQCMLVVKL